MTLIGGTILSTFQISHVCAVLLTSILFPISLTLLQLALSGGTSENVPIFGTGIAFLMFVFGPIFLLFGPLIGLVVHFNVVPFAMKLIIYLIAGSLCGVVFHLATVNGGDIRWFILCGSLAGLNYFLIQFFTETIINKYNLDRD